MEKGGRRERDMEEERKVVSTFDLRFSPKFQFKLENFLMPKLFKFSKPTTFISGTFPFEAWFES
jgi:hypothetical protein